MLPSRMTALGTARSVIRELFEYGNQRAAVVGRENVFDFSIGNPSVPPPPQVLEETSRLLEQWEPTALHGYTSAQGDSDARELLAASLRRRFGGDVQKENLYFTVGAAGALCCCFHGLTCPGDAFVVLAPYFPEYKVYIQGAGAAMTLVPPSTTHDQLNFPALEAAITAHTKGVVINSPNNPSGVVYTAQTLAALGALLTRKQATYGHPIYLISDEPYRELVYGNTVTPWVPDFYPNTLVCYSYSKSISLPGERIGYLLVPPTVTHWQQVYAALCGAGRSLGYVNAPSLFQRVAARCDGLTGDLSIYAANRTLLVNGLTNMGYTLTPPDGTFYLWLDALGGDSQAFCAAAQALDLLLVPGEGFGCPGKVRLSFCVPTVRVEGALPLFQNLTTQYGGL